MRDLIGERFGRLLVLKLAASRATSHSPRWLCRCDCGVEREVFGANLTRGRAKSCGCYRREVNGTGETRKNKMYAIWRTMRARCSNPNDRNYHRYGGRGISVCDRWQLFANFLADVGEQPAGLTLDRINNDGNYEPGNVRWATRATQVRNRSVVVLNVESAAEIAKRSRSGETARSLAREFGVGESAVQRIKQGLAWRPDEAPIAIARAREAGEE